MLVGGGLFVVLSMSTGQRMQGPAALMFPITMVGSTLASVAFQAGAGAREADLTNDRDNYLAYLGGLGGRFADAAAAQRDRLRWNHPVPAALWMLAGTDRMWERRREDADFGVVRIGVGMVRADAQPVAATRTDLDELGAQPDPVTAGALRCFVDVHTELAGLPITVALHPPGLTVVDGAEARSVLRAAVCQLAVLHSPRDVMVAMVASSRVLAHWEWVKWLPHNQSSEAIADSGPAPMFYANLAAALEVREPGRLMVIVVDEGAVDAREVADNAVTVLAIGADDTGPVRVNGNSVANPDRFSAVDALVCARRLAPYQDSGEDSSSLGWLDQLGMSDIGAGDLNTMWNNRIHRRLRIPIGTTEGGETFELDINEAAQNGMGPHGLCIGATGSGKSELLRSVALGMIAAHSPETLNLILVDFKGGATFLDLDRCQHVAAVITNLADEAHLVERMQDALSGEINRRQQMLRAAGNLAGIAEYRRARTAGGDLPPMPALFVIVDEFSELLSRHPDFIDVFVAIGRLGRSLGIHLLLASQRLDEGRLRGLDSHLSYRICLKTLSPAESRGVLGTPDAYQLPSAPGAAYLKVGAGEPARFQSAFVSGPVSAQVPSAPAPVSRLPLLFAATTQRTPKSTVPRPSEPTLLEFVLDAVADVGPPAHPVWLAPLERSPSLDAVLEEVGRIAGADLMVPIGLVDRVFEQRRTAMVVDLSGAAGNVAIVGATQSGKTTALRTLVQALTVRHGPHQVQVYCLDLGGGGLSGLADLPHVGVVAGRRDIELVTRTILEITALVQRREALFAELGVESIAEYRRRRDGGDLAGHQDPYGDVFLVIDGWATLRQDFPGLESTITSLAAEGLSLGIHVVLTAPRWADIRPALKDQIGTRIELRLGEPMDSEIDRKRARSVPRDSPGRGLTPDGLPLTIAVPRLRSPGYSWSGQQAPAITVLPARVDYRSLVANAGGGEHGLLLGLDDRSLAPVAVDLRQQPHLLILGDSGCGKTSVLRMLAHEILRTTSGRARLIFADPRRTSDGASDVSHVATTGQLCGLVADLMLELSDRINHPDADPAIYLLVDDYDLLSARNGSNPLEPLLPVLPHARDIGLHLVVARRSGGAARALYEPVLSAMRDVDAITLQMSSTADDGALLGSVRPRALVPGRGTLIDRVGGERLVQVAWLPPQ